MIVCVCVCVLSLFQGKCAYLWLVSFVFANMNVSNELCSHSPRLLFGIISVVTSTITTSSSSSMATDSNYFAVYDCVIRQAMHFLHLMFLLYYFPAVSILFTHALSLSFQLLYAFCSPAHLHIFRLISSCFGSRSIDFFCSLC